MRSNKEGAHFFDRPFYGLYARLLIGLTVDETAECRPQANARDLHTAAADFPVVHRIPALLSQSA